MDNNSDVDIDVEDTSYSQDYMPQDSSVRTSRRISRPTEKAKSAPAKKRRNKAIQSDEDDRDYDTEPKRKRRPPKKDDDYNYNEGMDVDEEEAVAYGGEDSDEDDFVDEPKKPLKRKGSMKLKSTASKGSKRKGKGDDYSRKAGRPASPSSSKHDSTPKDDSAADNDFLSFAEESQSKQIEPIASQPASPKDKPTELAKPPKKQKLPTIRKNKTAQASTELSATAKAPVPNTVEALAAITPAASAARNQKAKDFDLRDPNVYADILKQAANPRPGSSRREKDERRKELNLMRDQYKLKLEMIAKSTFDLQEQREKIEKFDEPYKTMHHAISYPNVLGAKMRQEHMERQRRLERRDENKPPPQPELQNQWPTEPEEGELPPS